MAMEFTYIHLPVYKHKIHMLTYLYLYRRHIAAYIYLPTYLTAQHKNNSRDGREHLLHIDCVSVKAKPSGLPFL